jgi:lipid-A-disaccharide synthase
MKKFMLIAGETSGDLLASELVSALRVQMPEATFIGAGGPRMAAAGVELAFDMTQLAVTGITDVVKNYFAFRRRFNQLLALAEERRPDAVIGVDYGGFNLRFGQAVKRRVRQSAQASGSWDPKIVQFVSPQVWASRPGRANQMEADYDLLLSIFPFEKAWYASHAPRLRVEFVGHPMLDRQVAPTRPGSGREIVAAAPEVLLLPGSRRGELKRHLPVMLAAVALMQKSFPAAKVRMVLPNAALAELARTLGASGEIQIGDLPAALVRADVAMASTGTVTMECAFFGVPTVTLYKTSWLTYEIGKRLITVNSLTMPNLMSGQTIYPEFIQQAATAEHLAGAAMELLQDQARRETIKAQLAGIIGSLGQPGATRRAAEAVAGLFNGEA